MQQAQQLAIVKSQRLPCVGVSHLGLGEGGGGEGGGGGGQGRAGQGKAEAGQGQGAVCASSKQNSKGCCLTVATSKRLQKSEQGAKFLADLHEHVPWHSGSTCHLDAGFAH